MSEPITPEATEQLRERLRRMAAAPFGGAIFSHDYRPCPDRLPNPVDWCECCAIQQAVAHLSFYREEAARLEKERDSARELVRRKQAMVEYEVARVTALEAQLHERD